MKDKCAQFLSFATSFLNKKIRFEVENFGNFDSKPRSGRGLFLIALLLDSEMRSVLYINFPLLLCPGSALRSGASVRVVGIFLSTPLQSISLIFRIMNLAIFETKKV